MTSETHKTCILDVQTFDIDTDTVDILRKKITQTIPENPITALPSTITAEITVKKRIVMVYIPFSETLEHVATYRVKSWKDRFTLHKRRFYLYKRPKDNKFYWDVRDVEDTRTSCLFGPFDTNEEAYDNLSRHYGFRTNSNRNEMERME